MHQAGWQAAFRTLCQKITRTWNCCPEEGLLASWPLAGIWEYGSGSVSSQPLTDKSGSLCLNCSCKQYGLFPMLSIGNLEIWYMPGRGYLHDWPPLKTLSTESLMRFCFRQPFHTRYNSLLDKGVSCVTLWGENSRKLLPCFLQTLPPEPFPFEDFVLYPFAVTNHSHEWNFGWALWVCLVNHQTWWWSWGYLTHAHLNQLDSHSLPFS